MIYWIQIVFPLSLSLSLYYSISTLFRVDIIKHNKKKKSLYTIIKKSPLVHWSRCKNCAIMFVPKININFKQTLVPEEQMSVMCSCSVLNVSSLVIYIISNQSWIVSWVHCLFSMSKILLLDVKQFLCTFFAKIFGLFQPKSESFQRFLADSPVHLYQLDQFGH